MIVRDARRDLSVPRLCRIGPRSGHRIMQPRNRFPRQPPNTTPRGQPPRQTGLMRVRHRHVIF
jgi:hypothetical protein